MRSSSEKDASEFIPSVVRLGLCEGVVSVYPRSGAGSCVDDVTFSGFKRRWNKTCDI